MHFFPGSLSQSLSAVLRSRIGAAAEAGSVSWRSFRGLLTVVTPWAILATVGSVMVAWALAMLALVG